MQDPGNIDWRAAAQAVAAALPAGRWPRRVREVLAGAENDRPWAVAFSGGADSLALLLMLAARRADGAAPPIAALHFNHRLRGAAADADAAFCRRVCTALGIECRTGEAGWATPADVSEAEAREARFAFFGRAMEAGGARWLFLGHHRDDVVETVLMRLARGSATGGLAAPRPVHLLADGSLRLRPLLDFRKVELEAALRTAGVPWCEDATNHGETFFRNRLRSQVIPAWAASAPIDLGAAVALSRERLEEDDEALAAWAERVAPRGAGAAVPLEPWRCEPAAVVRRVLWRWLGALGLGRTLGRPAFDELLDAVRQARAVRLSAGAGTWIVLEGGELRVVDDGAGRNLPFSLELPLPGEVRLPDGAAVSAAWRTLDEPLRAAVTSGALDDGATAFLDLGGNPPPALGVRGWQPGDRYQPLGLSDATKLQDQFVNRRIPRNRRSALPVVHFPGRGILWVPGLPPAHGFRITAATTAVLQLTYRSVVPPFAPTHV